jgi:Fe-S cluster assembly protein SufD
LANQIITGTKTIIKTVTKPEVILEYTVRAKAHLYVLLLVSATTDHTISARIHLSGKKAKATVIGLVRGQKNAQVTFHTLQHHANVETTSNLLVKSILDDASKLSYEGSIVVDPKAQKTDAYQRNENLLLGEFAHAKSEPALEILANDVRCTHGATIGTLNEEELWYLATRGIAGSEARSMIANGFLRSAFGLIDNVTIRTQIEKKSVLP